MNKVQPYENSYFIGHEEAERMFLNAWKNSNIHNSWIISGLNGIGKATLAYRIARFLLSADENNRQDYTSLNVDENNPTFRLIANQAHPDLKVIERDFIDSDKKKIIKAIKEGEAMDEEALGELKKSAVIKVDEVRTINEFLGKKSFDGNWRIVIIDSAEVSGALIAGGAVYVDDSTDSHTATYNTVNIGGAYAIEHVSLYGAYVDEDSYEAPSVNDDLFTGNTLNLDASLKTGTTTVGQVANFETINIKVGDVTNGAIILNAKGGAILGDGNSKGTTVNLLSVDTGNLDAGNYITLISNADGTLANEGQKQFVPIGNSIALGYIGQTNLETDDVVFNIEGKGVTPKTKVLNESRAAEMAFLNSAADLLQDQDIHKAGKHVFGAVRGIYNKYKTGSSVDISGMGLVTGVANTWAGDSSDLTGAVFVEAGWGSFDTKNDIMGSVQRGDGDSYYYGTGLIGKYDVTQGLFSGLYAEAAAHVGIISTDYSNAGLTTLNGVKASYDTDSLYYAAHATAGYRWNVTDKFDLDLSATYLWNYLESQEVKIAADKFDFDSVQSHRMRLAAEVGYTGDKGFRPYAGVAWEREFDGEAGGSVAGYRIEEADLGGNSGLAWAGVTFEPKEGGPVKADAEITTYFGQRKGVSGRVWVRYEF